MAESTSIVQREYVWVDDMPLALFADLDTGTPKQFYIHPDHLDRPTKMTDSTKAVVWDAYYWPFGEVRSITGSATLNLRFPGQYFLVESGLHYNWNRHYDPTTGRYIQADPNRDVIATRPVNLDGGTLTARGGISGGSQLPIQIASAGDFNRQIGSELPEFVDGPSVYGYAKASPAVFTDPSGLCAEWDTLCKIAARNAGLPPEWQRSDNDEGECEVAASVLTMPFCMQATRAGGIFAGIACTVLTKVPSIYGCKKKTAKKAPICEKP